MFGRSSRYYALDNTLYQDKGGQRILYKQRRFLPQGPALPLLTVATTKPGDRLDLLAARTIGAPDQFWRICDANNAMNPFELLDESAGTLRIAQLQFQDQSQ